MREILFRGKRKDNGEWFEGFYCKSGEKAYIIYDNEIAIGYVSMKEVIPETVGQYTGLCDKTGKKIFEGDIVESRASEVKEDWKIWQVGFEDGCFVFDSVRKSIKSRRKFKHEQNMLCVDEIKFYGLEVIGNIHDNPDLMRGDASDA